GTVDMGAYEWVAPAPPGTLYADIRRPDDSGDGLSWLTAKKTIQAALALASEGGAVLVAPGAYEPISRIDNAAITVRAVSGAARTLIDGGYDNRCATLGGELYHGTNTVLEGFTLMNGNTFFAAGSDGGGAYGGTLNHCVLTGNAADNGGGACYSTLNDCRLSDNDAFSDGGGAYGSTLNRCTLTDNKADWGFGGGGGGACYCTLTDCTLTGNEAGWGFGDGGGGAYYCTLTDCTLTGNEAWGDGGGAYGCDLTGCFLTGNEAIWRDGGGAYDCTLTGCFLTGNEAYYGGGAYGCTLTDCFLTGNEAMFGGGTYDSGLDNCTLVYNRAVVSYEGGDGGGAYGSDLANCHVEGNTAEGDGGGAYNCTLGNCELRGNTAIFDGGGSSIGTQANCLFVDNTARNGGGLYYGVTVNCTVTRNTADYGGGTYMGAIANSIVWDNTAHYVLFMNYWNGTFTYSCAPDLPPSNGNIDENPRFASPGAGNFHLQPAPRQSPCINAGNNALVIGFRDLDGNRRIWDGTVDMGCYESGSQPDGIVFHVDENQSDDSGDGFTWATAKKTLQGAADVATLLGDIVLVTNGTYAAFAVVGEPITIRSIEGAAKTFIDGANANRCATLSPSDRTSSALVGFTLQNGVADLGGGAVGGFLVDCVFTGNHATLYGGGAAGGILMDCTLDGNDSDHMGGGAYDCTLVNCTLTGNTADYGGGAAQCALLDCTLTANEAQSYGGGVFGAADGSRLLHCTLSGNKVLYGDGGGAYGKCEMLDCLIENNIANGHGGGVHGADTAVIANSRIIGNTAANNGGGTFRCRLQDSLVAGNEALYNGGVSYGEAYNCTVAGNTATVAGGAYGTIFVNSILWGNTAPTDPDYPASSCEFYNSCAPGLWPSDGNIASDPSFVNPANGDYRLQPGSGCINKGSDLLVGETSRHVTQFLNYTAELLAETEDGYNAMLALYPSLALPPVTLLDRIAHYRPGCDLDGNLRIWDGRVDMGCYEFGSVPPDDDGNGDLTLLITDITVGDPVGDLTMREITLDFAYDRADGATLAGVTILVRTWHDLGEPPVSLAPPATLDDHGGGTATLTVIIPADLPRAFFRIEAP
ncbi:MAG: hypothetical protein FWG50_09160, partial [Kiritimatiellaeota bacterium]|nr:hypothetical protein [Kiritimatiellota bacterium]